MTVFLTGPRRLGQFAAADFSLCCVKLTPISVIMPSSELITLTLFASAPADCQADDGRLPTFQSPVNTTRISQTVVKTNTTGALRDEELKQEEEEKKHTSW